jgi:chromosome partitioning protein
VVNYGIIFTIKYTINIKRKDMFKLIIAVNNNKGGVLKTSTVTNIAGVLANRKKKVLIVDADNQSNVSLSFGENPDNFRTSLYDVLVGGVPPEDAIYSVHKYIDVLPSNTDLVSFEFDVIGDSEHYPEPFYLMKEALNHLRNDYDYILIDTPPSLSLMNGNVFSFVDEVLIPFEPEAYAMRSLIAVVQTINDFKEEYNPEINIIGILPTKVVFNSNLHIGIKEETRKFAFENSINMFTTEIPRTVQYANAVGFDRTPVTLLKKAKDEKAKLFYSLWDEIENKIKGSVVK